MVTFSNIGLLTTLTCKHPESETTCTLKRVDSANKTVVNTKIPLIQRAEVVQERMPSKESGEDQYRCQLQLTSRNERVEIPLWVFAYMPDCSSMTKIADDINGLAQSRSPLTWTEDTRLKNLSEPVWYWTLANISVAFLLSTLASLITLTPSQDVLTIDKNLQLFKFDRRYIRSSQPLANLPLQQITGFQNDSYDLSDDLHQRPLKVWLQKGERARGECVEVVELMVWNHQLDELKPYLTSPFKTENFGHWIVEQTPTQLTIFYNPNPVDGELGTDRMIYAIDKSTGYFTDRSDMMKSGQPQGGTEKRYLTSTIQAIELDSKEDSLGRDDYELTRICLIFKDGQRQPISSYKLSHQSAYGSIPEHKVINWLNDFLYV